LQNYVYNLNVYEKKILNKINVYICKKQMYFIISIIETTFLSNNECNNNINVYIKMIE